MHPEIEKLIDLALADGVLTDKEKEILQRKAQDLNVDMDEFQMVLDAKLHIKQSEATSKQKSQKEGELKKCPSCGEILESFISKCPSCGYEIRGKEANQIISEIEKKIESVRSDYKVRIANATKRVDRDHLQICEQYDAISNVINSMPVPTTKEDLIEVISYCYPKRYDVHNGPAYEAKYHECLSKLEILALKDPSLQAIINNFKGKVSSEDKKLWRMVAFIGIPVFVIIIVIVIYTLVK